MGEVTTARDKVITCVASLELESEHQRVLNIVIFDFEVWLSQALSESEAFSKKLAKAKARRLKLNG